MSILSLVYVSSAKHLLSGEELLSILQTSRRNNTQAGISGMLLYKGGNFMQALEGEADEIHRLHTKILADPRHHGMMTLLKKTLFARQFQGWSMGFCNLADPLALATPGFNDFLDMTLAEEEVRANPSRALKLLDTFRQKM